MREEKAIRPVRSDDIRAADIAAVIMRGFETYGRQFAEITRRARQNFESREWPQGRRDTLQRLDLYSAAVSETVVRVKQRMGRRSQWAGLWEEVKSHVWQAVENRRDGELACTYHNSVIRKTLDIIGFEPALAFRDPPVLNHLFEPMEIFLFHLNTTRITSREIKLVLTNFNFETPFANLDREAQLCASKIEEILEENGESSGSVHIEMVPAPFFRGMGAYLVGRFYCGGMCHPLVFSIHNNPDGLAVDALLTTQAQLRVLFSFSRAYFFVETDCPAQLISLLKDMMPRKRLAELYIALGYHKHGKTELYRDLLHHQQVCSQDRFDFSPGQTGKVMITFNIPNDDLIYKLIRDRFAAPKQTSARQVIEKYEYVFKHDRAGRLLDVQTFENLELADCCFMPQLLKEIGEQAHKVARVSNGCVLLEHVYVERRVTPLDIFLQTADASSTAKVIIDFGQAIKDLAKVNVFPGDLLLKNFGVTSLERVVFYDYDELRPLTDCRFRRLPQARNYDEALESEPWFLVADNDVFPEELPTFLGFAPELEDIFRKYHGDLLEPEFWWRIQDQIQSGVWIHIRPYGPAQKLHPEFDDAGESSP